MKTFVFLCIIGVALAATSVSLPSTHKDHPGKCWIESEKVAVEPGTSYSKIGRCIVYHCGSDFSYSGVECSSISTSPPCRVTKQDNTKLYPDCCPKIEC